MDKKKWVLLSVGIVVVLGVLGLIKVMPFWATLVALVAFLVGELMGAKFKGANNSSSLEKDLSEEKVFVQELTTATKTDTTAKTTKKSKKSK